MSDLLDRIDEVTTDTCYGPSCSRSLTGSVSDWFCSPECQEAWTSHNADVQGIAGYQEPLGGWCGDAAHWEPTVCVGDWCVTAQWASGLLIAAKAEMAGSKRPERI